MQIVKSHPLKLGIIGGLGPLATAWFYELVTRMTKADCDQDHLDIMILSKPGIPDRTAYIIDKNKKNPVPEIIISGRQLAAQGAEILVMPCVTAHCFYDQIDQALTVPVVNMISETAECLKQEGFHRVGLMATDGTIGCQLFQRTLDSLGIETVIPDRKSQQGIMHIIYNNIKADREIEMGYFAGSAGGSGGIRVLCKRIIPCLDVDGGRVVKGTNFINLRDAGDPVELASLYDKAGADELIFLDITASHEKRDIMLDVARRTAE